MQMALGFPQLAKITFNFSHCCTCIALDSDWKLLAAGFSPIHDALILASGWADDFRSNGAQISHI